jgi:hypothetical protein
VFAAANKTVVRRDVEEVPDRRRIQLVAELCTDDCVTHRPELAPPIVGIENPQRVVTGLAGQLAFLLYPGGFLMADGDMVGGRLRQDVIYAKDWQSRVGPLPVVWKRATWTVHAIAPLRERKIAED